jgi:hypothetical protein
MSKANAQRTINVIKRTIEKSTANGASVRYSPAVIHEGGSQFVSAYIAGQTDSALDDIRVPAGAYVSSGDYVIVSMSDEGKSWINEILPYSDYAQFAIDPNAAQIKIGDGTTEPDAGEAGQVILSGGPSLPAYWSDNFADTVRVAVKNNTGSTLTAGTVVYINGVSGQIPTVTKASASTEAASSKTLGVITKNITDTNQGTATTFGVLKNVNTVGYSSGDNLWLSTTAGEWTTTRPSAPNHGVHVGYVITGGSSSAGRIFVYVQNGFELGEIHNVSSYAPTDGQALVWDSASSYWKPGTVAVSSAYGLPSGGSSGQYLKKNSASDYDATWYSLLGTTSPTTQAFADAASAGTSLEASHADHKHAMPSDPTTSNMDGNARVNVKLSGTSVGTRRSINFSAGTGTGISVSDSSGTETVTVSISSPASATSAPSSSYVGDVASIGLSGRTATEDHVHGREGFGSVAAQTSFGSASTNGVATTVSRSDHAHGTPTNPVTAHEAASDPHTGYLQESVVSGFASSTVTLSDTATAGTGTTALRSNAAIAAFDSTSPSTQAIGDSASVGTAAYAARRDHKHALPSFGAATAETSFGLSSANGTATTIARSDHTHGTPTNPVTAHEAASDPHTGYLQESVVSGFDTSGVTLSDTATAGTGTTGLRSNAAIAAFDATSPSTQAIGDTAVVGTASYAARRDHKHAMPSFSGTGSASTISRSDHTHTSPYLDDLTDVVISSAVSGQLLSYNGTNWVNASAAATTQSGTKLVLTTAQSIGDSATAGDVAISFGSSVSSEYWDTAGWHSDTNPTRITPTVAGKMLVTAQVSFASSTSQRWGYLVVNGTPSTGEVIGRTTVQATAGGVQTYFTVVGWYDFDGVDDYVELYVRQNSGGSLNALAQAASNPGTSLAVHTFSGATGATGPGVATGGTSGQYLKKNSASDYDTTWYTLLGSTSPTTQAFSDAASAGTSLEASHADHKHAMPANPVSYGTVTQQTSFGSSGSDGTASTLSRSDHTHGTPTNPVTAHEAAADPHTGYLQESVVSGFASSTITLSDTASAGTGTTGLRSNAAIAAFDATVPSTSSFTNATGSASFAARRDHTHALSLTTAEAYITATTSISGTTYADITGASISLAAGTWLIMGVCHGYIANAASIMNVAITDSANTVITEGAQGISASGTASVNQWGSISLSAIVTPATTTTYKLRGARALTTITGTWTAARGSGVNITNNATTTTNLGTGIRAIRLA